MKVRILLVIMALAMTPALHSQGLGGLLKKAKTAVEKVAPAQQTPQAAQANPGAAAISLTDGIEFSNPFPAEFKVESIALYGLPTSQNYGNVYVVLKVTNLLPEVESVSMGSSYDSKLKMIAVDASGKVFNVDTGGQFRYDTPVDIPVVVNMDQPEVQFLNVPKSVKSFSMIRINLWMDADHHKALTFKNLPIIWPEEEVAPTDDVQ